jgi:exonuclease VII large subunit
MNFANFAMAYIYKKQSSLKNMSSFSSLNARLAELTRQLKQNDTELDEELDKTIQADEEDLDRDLDAIDRDIDTADKNLRQGIKQKVEAVKKGIKDRKDDLRQRIEAAKKAPKDRASKEAEDALNRMQEDLSNEDLVSAHIDRWIANQWLKASK